MRDICLVIPPSPFLLDERVFPSLGILRVAAVLRERGYKVEVLDLSGVTEYEKLTDMYALEYEPYFWGITATTPQIPAAIKIAATIKRVQPTCRVALGGTHATLVNASCLHERASGRVGRASRSMGQLLDNFDSVVAGDGEKAIFQVLETGSPFVDADNSDSPLFLTSKEYDTLPLPARNLIDLKSYRYSIDGFQATSLIAQLGCPFNCGFCGGRNTAMLRRVRTRSSRSILVEMRHLFETYGYQGFMFYDDELNINKVALVSLMRGIQGLAKELGTEFHLRGFVKSELFTDEQAEAMYGAGFRWILAGFESGAPRILKSMGKGAVLDDNYTCVATAHKHGLKVKALMSIGHPGETEGTVEATERWLLQAKPDDFDVTIISAYPGTAYYDEAVETSPGIWTYTHPGTKDRLHAEDVDYTKVADYYKGDPEGGYQAHVFTDELSAKDLVWMRGCVESRVRGELGIPYNSGSAVRNFEHSMGQTPQLGEVNGRQVSHPV